MLAAEQRKDLLTILENYVDDQELRKYAFLTLGSGSYENLRGETKIERMISLIEKLEFRNKAEELVEYIHEFNPDIKLPKSLLNLISNKNNAYEVEFMNRVDEVGRLTNPYSPAYLLISAPPGYGKTRLLETARDRFQENSWFCIHVKLKKGQILSIQDLVYEILEKVITDNHSISLDNYKIPQEYGFVISQQSVSHLRKVDAYGMLILIDQIEVLDEEIVKQFLNEVIPGLSNGLRTANYLNRLKVILSGNYVNHLDNYSYRIPLSLMSVTPFSFPVVQQTVAQFMSEKGTALSAESVQEVASHIMYLTGGHPGCMVQLLQKYPYGWPAEAYFLGHQEQNYEEIIEPVIEGIRVHIKKSLVDTFDTLSVVRYFNSRFLKHLIDKGLIRWTKSEYELEDTLTQTRMITRTDGFLHDAITQRLLSIHLRKTDPEYFMTICQEAIEFYTSSLQEPGISRPDILAVELLFQELQHIHYKGLGGIGLILETTTTILEKLVSERNPREQIRNFSDQLKNDWELRFNLNYFMREGVYNNEYPFNQLIEKVNSFLEDMEVVNA